MTYSASLRAAMMAGASAVAVIATPAAAQAIEFAIPAQGLSGALQQFAVRTNRDLLYSPELVANLRSPGLSGSFTPEDGLRRLLAGTALAFHQPTPNVFVIQRNGPRVASASLQSDMGEAPAEPAAAATTGEQTSLTGTVFDGATGTPIAGAVVRIEGTDFSAATDERGAYRFPGLPAGSYNVTLDYLGDAPRSESVTIVAGEEASLNFTRRPETGEIVVYGYSSAIQRALNQQRTALNNATIISEDLLGGFPAETVSEALRRVPGVAFGRDENSGEGSRITVRGFSSEAINVQVNGVDLQGTSFERTVDLSGYLAENISTITIHKTLLPSHQATASGGFVQIETRSGLDYGNFHASGSIEGERPFQSGFGNEWQATATVGGKITSNFGIVGTLSYRNTNRQSSDVSVSRIIPAVYPVGFTSITFIPASQQFPFDPELDDQLVTGVGYVRRQRDEATLAASVNLAWDIGDHTRLRLDLQRNERDTFLYIARTGITFLTAQFDMPVPELGNEVRRRAVLSSFRPNIAPTTNDQNVRQDTISLRGDTDVGRWQFRYKGGLTLVRERSRNSTMNLLGDTLTNIGDLINPATAVVVRDDDPARTPRIVDGGFTFAPNSVPIPSLTQAGLDVLFDPARYRLLSAARSLTDSRTETWALEGSARYAPDSWLQYVEAGFKFDRASRRAADSTFATITTGTLRNFLSYAPIAGRNTFLSDIDPSLMVRQPFDNVGVNFAVPSLSLAGNEALFDALDGLLTDNPSTPFNEARFTLNDFTDADPIAIASALQPASTLETKLAGYVEAHLEFGRFEIVGGLRYERTQRTGSALLVPSFTLPVGAEPRETFIAAGLVDFVENRGTDHTLTPSILVNYRPASNIVARLGYFRSTVHPTLQNLRRQPQYFINLRNNSVIVREGNPDLKPTVTDNFDFDVAYYFRGSPGLVRGGVFYKKTTNNFTNLLFADRPADIRDRVLEFFGPLVQTRPDLFTFNDQTQFLLQRPTNGEGGTIYGFELELIRRFDFLPGLLSGFGVIGNLTYTKGDFPTLLNGRTDDGVQQTFSLDRPLRDQSAWVYNAALTYQRGGFEGRLVYSRQSSSVEAYEIHDLNSIVPSYSSLDLRLSYNFRGPAGGLFTIFLEGDNLLEGPEDPDIRFATANTRGRQDAQYFFPDIYQFNGGRTLTLGVRARF